MNKEIANTPAKADKVMLVAMTLPPQPLVVVELDDLDLMMLMYPSGNI